MPSHPNNTQSGSNPGSGINKQAANPQKPGSGTDQSRTNSAESVRHQAVCELCGYAGKVYEKRTPAVVAMKQHEGGVGHRRAERLAYLRGARS